MLSITVSGVDASVGRRRISAPRPGGFTLVELLVVVTIIALLLAMLGPALHLGMLDRTRCQSNEHSMGQALMAYVADSGYYPGHVDSKAGSGAVAVWPPRLRPYVDGSSEVFWCPTQPEGFKWRKVFGGGGGYASQVHADRWGYELGEKMLNVHNVPFSYGYNDWGAHGAFVNSGLGADLWSWPPVRLTQVAELGNMIAIADNTTDGSWDYNIDPGNPREYPSKVHDGGANFLFCDSHVEWIDQKDATNINTNTDSGRAMNRRWNNSNEVERY